MLVLMLVMAVGCTENSRENTMSFTGGEDAGATATPPMATDDGDASTATSSDASQSQRDAMAELDFGLDGSAQKPDMIMQPAVLLCPMPQWSTPCHPMRPCNQNQTPSTIHWT